MKIREKKLEADKSLKELKGGRILTKKHPRAELECRYISGNLLTRTRSIWLCWILEAQWQYWQKPRCLEMAKGLCGIHRGKEPWSLVMDPTEIGNRKEAMLVAIAPNLPQPLGISIGRDAKHCRELFWPTLREWPKAILEKWTKRPQLCAQYSTTTNTPSNLGRWSGKWREHLR